MPSSHCPLPNVSSCDSPERNINITILAEFR